MADSEVSLGAQGSKNQQSIDGEQDYVNLPGIIYENATGLNTEKLTLRPAQSQLASFRCRFEDGALFRLNFDSASIQILGYRDARVTVNSVPYSIPYRNSLQPSFNSFGCASPMKSRVIRRAKSTDEDEYNPPPVIATNQQTDSQEQECISTSFFEQALFWIEQTHPDWKMRLNAKFGQIETICIPDSLDVGPNKFFGPTKPPAAGFDKDEVKKAKSRLKGEKGEETFFTEFRKLKMGGILIHGFNAQAFMKAMHDNAVIGFENIDSDEKHYECDFIFIHQRFGVVLIEVKGCDGIREMWNRYYEAADQLKRQIDGLENIYLRMSGEPHCSVVFRGIVCMPNFNTVAMRSTKKKLNPEVEQSLNLIDRTLLFDTDSFKQFWKAIPKQKWIITDKLIEFIIALFAYRSSKFMSSTCNALEIYRRIVKQDFKNMKMDQSHTVFFNEDQLKAIECKEKRVLIIGPPGTGKTLCLLQRAFSEAKIDKPGKVILALRGTHDLAAKFEAICAASQCADMIRKPVINSKPLMSPFNFSLADFSPDDDLFFDEISIGNGKKILFQLEKELAERKMQSGSTTVVVTGWLYPTKVIDMTKALEMFKEASFELLELQTVIRGTKTIIAEWKTHFPDHRVGHNITGTPIERHSFHLYSKMLDFVYLKIKCLGKPLTIIKATYDRLMRRDQCQWQQSMARDLAILTVNEDHQIESSYAFRIQDDLRKKGVRCGTITEQLHDPILIAVSGAKWALSYEWPIVVVVTINNNCKADKEESSYIIAASRAIAKLIVIECAQGDAVNTTN